MKTSFAILRGIILVSFIGLIVILGMAFQLRQITMDVQAKVTELDAKLLTLNDTLATTVTDLSKVETDLANASQNLANPETLNLEAARINLASASTTVQTGLRQNVISANSQSNQIYTSILNNDEGKITDQIQSANNLALVTLILTVLGILAMIFLLGTSFSVSRQARKEMEQQKRESKELGRKEGVIKVIGALDKDPSALQNVMGWLSDYQQKLDNDTSALQNVIRLLSDYQQKVDKDPSAFQTVMGWLSGNQQKLDKDQSTLQNIIGWLSDYQLKKQDADRAYRIFLQLMSRLSQKLGLQPVGKFGEIVIFDYSKHQTITPGLKQGDKVRIVEVGWQMQNEILRKPTVGREAA